MSSHNTEGKEDVYVKVYKVPISSHLTKASLLNLLYAVDNQSRYLGGGHWSKVGQRTLLNTIGPFRFPRN